MSLPAAWVDRLFQKLAVTYGRDFTSRWEGMNADDVKADWGRELAGFAQSPDSIKYGLENLPADKPPTVLQFRDLCRRMPSKAPLALPPPDPNPEVAKAAIGALKRLSGASGSKAWAEALKRSEEKGGRLTKFQRDAWREVIGSTVD